MNGGGTRNSTVTLSPVTILSPKEEKQVVTRPRRRTSCPAERPTSRGVGAQSTEHQVMANLWEPEDRTSHWSIPGVHLIGEGEKLGHKGRAVESKEQVPIL
jgi:hypothetical protein